MVKLRKLLADPDFFSRDPLNFERATTRLSAAEAEHAAGEERWLELEMRREALGRESLA